jgi:hypothetical protein
MIIKVFLLTVCVVFLFALVFGLKLIIDKNSQLNTGTCKASFPNNEGFNCGCGSGICIENGTDPQEKPK